MLHSVGHTAGGNRRSAGVPPAVTRASCRREVTVDERERDAPATAGGTPALRVSVLSLRPPCRRLRVSPFMLLPSLRSRGPSFRRTLSSRPSSCVAHHRLLKNAGRDGPQGGVKPPHSKARLRRAFSRALIHCAANHRRCRDEITYRIPLVQH